MAWYHTLGAKLLSQFPSLYEKLTVYFASNLPPGVPESPWTRFEGDAFNSRVMLVTTGGVHSPGAKPFDMQDSRGDTSYRWVHKEQENFEITHDYYDHSDADEDVNCLFPLPLARKLSESGLIGSLTKRHLGFMGHIENPIVPKLMNESLPAMWEELDDRPDLVLLSPG